MSKLMTVITLIIGAVGIVTPIAWDYLKSRTMIEVQLLQAAKLLEPSEKIEKLEIRYDGKPIARVTRVMFAITNTGRTPIRAADFVTPLTVRFPTTAEMLDVRIERKIPADIEIKKIENFIDGSINVGFELLNPGDYVVFAVLLGGDFTKMNASARVANMPEILLTDRSKDGERKAKVSWWIYPLGLFSLLFFLMGSVAIFTIVPAERKLKQKIKTGEYKFPIFTTKAEYRAFIRKGELSSLLSDTSTNYFEQKLNNLRNEDISNEKIRAELNELIAAQAVGNNMSIFGVIFLIIFPTASLWYVTSTLYEAFTTIKIVN